MKLAQRWLKRSAPDAPLSLWLSAKFLLRDGQAKEARALLERVLGELPADHGLEEPRAAHQAAGELAALQMAGRQYTKALALLLNYDWWWDAAFVSEHVLTSAELKEYVDRNWPEEQQGYGPDGKLQQLEWGAPVANAVRSGRIRYLLARRLAREEQWAAAGAYYPPFWRSYAETYADAVRTGRDRKNTALTRAAALWKAARIARYEGMDLLGTEIEPDWFAEDGQYEPTRMADSRVKAKALRGTAPSRDELERIRKSGVSTPTRRFHYRYIAVGLAWEAADLMPDGREETAAILCEAGGWLKNRDPKEADRFYKALVRRCGDTPTGREAAKARWFPKSLATEQR
jgi:hypothetical protein